MHLTFLLWWIGFESRSDTTAGKAVAGNYSNGGNQVRVRFGLNVGLVKFVLLELDLIFNNSENGPFV